MENKYMKGMSKTASVYWHDSGKLSEIEEALSNGAVSITLNPFLTASALYEDSWLWREKAAPIAEKFSGDKKAEELTKLVVGYYAEKLKDIYKRGKAGEGYVCAQVDPSKSGNAAVMLEQAKSYASVAENVCIKLPTTKAGLKVCEECAALGMNVVMTVGMTLPQALAAGRAITRGHERARENGIKPGFGAAVIMVGRLDDYLRDVIHDNELDIQEDDIILAGAACYKRAIKMFKEAKLDAFLMAAAFRGTNQIKELAGSDTMISVAPKMARCLADEEMTEDISGRDIDEKVIERLYKVKEFVRAYESDGMKPEEFITYGAVNRTTFQFIESGWNLLKNYHS